MHDMNLLAYTLATLVELGASGNESTHPKRIHALFLFTLLPLHHFFTSCLRRLIISSFLPSSNT